MYTSIRKGSCSPSPYSSEYPWPQISRRIYGVSAIETKCHPYGNDQKPHAQGRDSLRWLHVLRVCYSHDADQQEGCSKNLQTSNKQYLGIHLQIHIHVVHHLLQSLEIKQLELPNIFGYISINKRKYCLIHSTLITLQG